MLVCRPLVDGPRTADLLAALGAEAVLAPVLAPATLPFALPDGRPEAVIATSARAVEALTHEQAVRLGTCIAFAVGPRTAAAWRRAGFSDVRATQGDADLLANLIAATLPGPARLLYLAGRVREPRLEDALARAGYRVDVVETYAARPAEPWGEAVRTAFTKDGVGACLHYSVRSATLATAYARAAGCAAEFASAAHVCLSDAVAAPLRSAAIADVVVAPEPTEASLMQALSAILRTR